MALDFRMEGVVSELLWGLGACVWLQIFRRFRVRAGASVVIVCKGLPAPDEGVAADPTSMRAF